MLHDWNDRIIGPNFSKKLIKVWAPTITLFSSKDVYEIFKQGFKKTSHLKETCGFYSGYGTADQVFAVVEFLK